LTAPSQIGQRPGVDGEGGALAETARLVLSARAGDRDAFGRLYALHVRLVHGILLARVRHADALDLVQDVFLIALRRLDRLREPEAFAPWIAAIARNRAVDHFRRARDMDELPDEVADPPRPSAEALAALDCIRALPEAYRETLTLRLVEGMTGPEIAARTGLTPASVRVNLHRGMKLLRQRLGDDR
jgi:RNA polymerase sigma-70 factor (ECF subfamily)